LAIGTPGLTKDRKTKPVKQCLYCCLAWWCNR